MNSVLYRGAGPLWTPGKPAAPSPLLANLVSYWKLDEASTGVAPVTRNDSHGTNHLTDNNTVTSAAGKLGNAAQFTAANSESLSRIDNASLRFGDEDFSLAFWFWPDVASLGFLVAKFISAVNANFRIYQNSATVGFGIFDSTGAGV